MILRAYKTELDPTAEQRRALARHVAGARVAHNWVLEQWRIHDAARALARGARALAGLDWRTGGLACVLGYALAALHRGVPVKVRTPKGSPQRYRYRAPAGACIPDFSASSIDWNSRIVFLKTEQPERFGWLSELSAFVVREAAGDVADGWKHFFEHLKAGRYERAGEPRFRKARKRRYHADQPNPIRTTDRAISIPGVGWVRLKEHGYFPVTRLDSHAFVTGGKACGLGIEEKDGRWYCALRCEVPEPRKQARGSGRALRDHPVPRAPGKRVGVEVGVRVLGSTYDGEISSSVVEKGLRDDERILTFIRSRKLWERRMARRWRSGMSFRDQSAGWREARDRVEHYHARIVHLRDDRVGKFARKIVDMGAEVVVMREPAIHAMLSRKLAGDARARNVLAPDVHNARMGDLRERIVYKQKWAGGSVELVPREDPTTRRCSMCQTVRSTAANYPNFACASCGHREDRDAANAPRNLYQNSTGGDPGEATPRSAESKPPQGDNGRENRPARASGQPQATAPDGGETTALGSDNRVRPGASHSVRLSVPHHEIEFDRFGDAKNGSSQFREDTAQPEAEDRDRSQIAPQRRDIAQAVRGGSGSIS